MTMQNDCQTLISILRGRVQPGDGMHDFNCRLQVGEKVGPIAL